MPGPRLHRLISEGKSRPHISEERLNELEKPQISPLTAQEISSAKGFFMSNIFSFFLVMLSGLITLLYIPSILEVLDLTGNSASPQKTFVRYMRTVNHTFSWFWDNASQAKSLRQVRRAHLHADKSTATKRNAFMTQYDMVVTQWAFVGLVYTRPEVYGIRNPPQEGLDALRILMHAVGYSLGIEEEFNLCSGSVEHTREYSKDIYKHIILPALDAGSIKSDKMTNTLLLGINTINPFVLPLSFGKWCFESLGSMARASSIHIPFPSGTYFLYWLQGLTVRGLLNSPFARPFLLPCLNALMRFNIYLCNWLYPPMKKMNDRLYMS